MIGVDAEHVSLAGAAQVARKGALRANADHDVRMQPDDPLQVERRCGRYRRQRRGDRRIVGKCRNADDLRSGADRKQVFGQRGNQRDDSRRRGPQDGGAARR